MYEKGIDPRNGLTEGMFVFATSLIPCTNVDWLVRDQQNKVLSTWYNDKYYGEGWHILGDCLRMHESLLDRVQKTVLKELGTNVIIQSEEFITREGILKRDRSWLENKMPRLHNIFILFEYRLPESFQISNSTDNEQSKEFLK